MKEVNAYIETVARMEPEIAMVDNGAAAASISISLKRIADALETIASRDHTEQLGSVIERAIWNGMGQK